MDILSNNYDIEYYIDDCTDMDINNRISTDNFYTLYHNKNIIRKNVINPLKNKGVLFDSI